MLNDIQRKHPLWMQAFRLVHSINFTRLLVDRFARARTARRRLVG